jgi:hypothetical protein
VSKPLARIAGAAVALVGTLVVGVVVARLVWNRETAQAVGRLGGPTRADTTHPAVYSPGELAGLPAPVARYFTFALTPGVPLVQRATVRWTGEFLAQPSGDWSPFTANEVFVVHPPGFVWNASIQVARLLNTQVRDSYAQGAGRMRGKVAGLYSVVDDGDTPEMATAALQRYLAECVWFPTALLPSGGVRWTPIDDSTARASLTDRGVTAVIQFHFAADGEATRISALRYRSTGGAMVPTQWVGTIGHYQRVHGMMLPGSGEVEWELPEGRSPYWRGQAVSVEYQ